MTKPLDLTQSRVFKTGIHERKYSQWNWAVWARCKALSSPFSFFFFFLGVISHIMTPSYFKGRTEFSHPCSPPRCFSSWLPASLAPSYFQSFTEKLPELQLDTLYTLTSFNAFQVLDIYFFWVFFLSCLILHCPKKMVDSINMNAFLFFRVTVVSRYCVILILIYIILNFFQDPIKFNWE